VELPAGGVRRATVFPWRVISTTQLPHHLGLDPFEQLGPQASARLPGSVLVTQFQRRVFS